MTAVGSNSDARKRRDKPQTTDTVPVPREEWEALRTAVKRQRGCPGCPNESTHDTWIANRARALVDAATEVER